MSTVRESGAGVARAQQRSVAEEAPEAEQHLRAWKGHWTVAGLAAALSLFHIYTAVMGPLIAYQQRIIHLTGALVLAFLLYPPVRRGRWLSRFAWIDVFLALLVALPAVYVFTNYEALQMRLAAPRTVDLVVGGVFVVLLLEATRRTVGLPLFLVSSTAILFALFGGNLPGVLGHRGYSLRRLIDYLFSGTEGVFGIPIGVSATYVFMFVLFGAFLDVSGAGRFFIDLALALVGSLRGGPAKTAVVSSALIGTLTGSSVANVVTTGTFTIPLMIKSGYRRQFAGAVEAAASTGGQLMPPVMGAAAFVMAEYTGFPYSRIMLAAIIPALLYFWGVYVSVDLEAKRLGLLGKSKAELPRVGETVRAQGWIILPMAVMVWALFVGYTPARSGALACLALFALMATRLRSLGPLRSAMTALSQGAFTMVPVATACAAAGIIAGVLTLTGTGLKIAGLITTLSGGNLMVALLLTMVTCLVLGMGLPTTANYIVVATIAAPALTRMGLPVLVAHMFVFFFGVLADVTPPVALAAYAGAGLARANQMKTGATAFTIALAGFLAPYLFAFSPELLWIGVEGPTAWLRLLRPTLTSFLGIWMLGGGLRGHWLRGCTWYDRMLLLAAALLLIDPGLATDLVGAAVGAAVAARQTLAGTGKAVSVPGPPSAR